MPTRSAVQVFDSLIRHVGSEVVARLADPRKNLGMILEQIGRPLVGLAAHEAVEIVEAHPDGPLVVRPGDAVLKAGRVVVLAKPRRGIAVLLEDFTNGGALQTDDGIVARIAGGQLADHTSANRMMVAARDQRSPRGRTKSGGMKLRVTQSCLGYAIHRGRRDDTAKRARNTVALVVRHDEQDVGRAFGRHDARRPVRRGILDAFLDHAAKRQRRRRDLISVNRDVASGEPGVPLICWVQAEGATAMTATASIPERRICFADFIGVNLIC